MRGRGRPRAARAAKKLRAVGGEGGGHAGEGDGAGNLGRDLEGGRAGVGSGGWGGDASDGAGVAEADGGAGESGSGRRVSRWSRSPAAKAWRADRPPRVRFSGSGTKQYVDKRTPAARQWDTVRILDDLSSPKLAASADRRARGDPRPAVRGATRRALATSTPEVHRGARDPGRHPRRPGPGRPADRHRPRPAAGRTRLLNGSRSCATPAPRRWRSTASGSVAQTSFGTARRRASSSTASAVTAVRDRRDRRPADADDAR